ncbi:hypothetical protein [Reichenbachiella sp. MALMAid0571]|uniref:hypothetical protein n=1 Tax=Reichenbachiella sp. MALMAid0571 TaxID=3143939 RepID=UPI0032DF0199
MRNPEIYTEEVTLRNRINDVTIKYPEVLEMLDRKENESNIDFAVRINKVVNDGYAHYWKKKGIDKYNLRVPIWENYMLYFASFVNPEKYERYEFSDYKKNLERGVGLCSGHSIVVKGILMDNGMKAELMDIGGRHVVVRAELNDNVTYILDPDYGIVVPYDTAAVQANPELVREPYSKMADLYYPDAIDPYTTDFIVEIFGSFKKIYSVDNWFEHFSYWAIWIFPLLLMVPFGIGYYRQGNN